MSVNYRLLAADATGVICPESSLLTAPGGVFVRQLGRVAPLSSGDVGPQKGLQLHSAEEVYLF
jgi:hypothetical protein